MCCVFLMHLSSSILHCAKNGQTLFYLCHVYKFEKRNQHKKDANASEPGAAKERKGWKSSKLVSIEQNIEGKKIEPQNER